MNHTLQKLRELAQESVMSIQDSESKEQRNIALRAKFAAPLLCAFTDVEREFVRVAVMRQIWPSDYDQRDDRVAGLLVAKLGPETAPYGLKMAMPNGFLSFEVTLQTDELPVFRCIRDTAGQRPLSMDFPNGEHWLEYFYKIIADVIEL